MSQLCQISEELRFCFLKNSFDTQDFSHCNILTLFDTVDDEQFRYFFKSFLKFSVFSMLCMKTSYWAQKQSRPITFQKFPATSYRKSELANHI